MDAIYIGKYGNIVAYVDDGSERRGVVINYDLCTLTNCIENTYLRQTCVQAYRPKCGRYRIGWLTAGKRGRNCKPWPEVRCAQSSRALVTPGFRNGLRISAVLGRVRSMAECG